MSWESREEIMMSKLEGVGSIAAELHLCFLVAPVISGIQIRRVGSRRRRGNDHINGEVEGGWRGDGGMCKKALCLFSHTISFF